MATATATLNVYPYPKGMDSTTRRFIVNGTLALSANGTYATNGIPLAWKFVNYAGGAEILPVTGTATPVKASFFSNAGGTYQYGFDTTHSSLRISSAGTELANAAAITPDTIGFEIEFVKEV